MKKYIPFLIFAVLLLAVCASPLAYGAKLCGALVLVLAYTYYRRQVFFYMKGMGLMQKKQYAKAFPWFERALKAHVGEDGELNIANYFVLFGDADRGAQILEHFLTRNLENPQSGNLARMLQSLVCYRKGDPDRAIEIMEKMKEEGYRSVALYANLMLIYLDKGETKTALSLWDEADPSFKEDVGLRDVYGRILLMQENWEEAYKLYIPMLKEPVHAVNEFIHASQVFVHYGMAKEALLSLEKAKNGPFNQVNPYSEKMVIQLYDLLKEPSTRLMAAHLIDAHPGEIAAGKMVATPERWEYPSCDSDKMEGFATVPRNLANIAGQKEERLKEEATPNTDLDESDEEYLARHKEDDNE